MGNFCMYVIKFKKNYHIKIDMVSLMIKLNNVGYEIYLGFQIF